MPAQTDIQASSADPSADDFLAREKAILGDDADNFVTADDGAAFQTVGDDLMGGGDLLGGGGGGGDETAQFEQQFPDLSGANEVRVLPEPSCTLPCLLDDRSGHHITDGDLASSQPYFPTNICLPQSPRDQHTDQHLLHRLSHPEVPSPALVPP